MENITGKPQAMKKVNSELIKQALKKMGSATKAELAKATNISCTTVRTLLFELIEQNEIVSVGLDESSGGRPAERYMLNLNESLALAFFTYNNEINYIVTNPLGEIIENERIESIYENYNDSMYKFIDDLLKNKSSIKTIGIGVQGFVDNKSYFSGKEINNLEQFNIGEYIENKYNIPVILENDLNAIALGYSLNLMKKLHVEDLDILNMVYIHFTKSCVGAGVIANGELVRGSYNFAGELGFIPIDKGETLNQIIGSNPKDDIYVDTIARVISIINCIINPDFIVIGGDEFKFNLIDDIKKKSKDYISKDIMPDIFYVEDSREDYLTGINHLALEQMNSGIKLIDSTKKY